MGISLKTDADILDIEDLTKLSLEQKICPYFDARTDLNKAELIFLPYNYLIDPVARKAQKIDTRDAIVIFDEGHNLVSCILPICERHSNHTHSITTQTNTHSIIRKAAVPKHSHSI